MHHSILAANDRCGSKAESLRNGRTSAFASLLRTYQRTCVQQLCATTGLVHRTKQHLYSITSSARSRNDSGIVNPSALAAVRLMIR